MPDPVVPVRILRLPRGVGGNGSAGRHRARGRRLRPHGEAVGASMARVSPPPESLADLLVTLVNIPSVSGNEHAIADYLETRLGAAQRGSLERTRRSVVWKGPGRDRPLL